MTKKDYVLIARAIRLANSAPGYLERHKLIIGHIADALAQDNPRFDRERFLKACGVEG